MARAAAAVRPLSRSQSAPKLAARSAPETGLSEPELEAIWRTYKKTRDEIAHLTGAPTLVANLLVARVAAELLGR